MHKLKEICNKICMECNYNNYCKLQRFASRKDYAIDMFYETMALTDELLEKAYKEYKKLYNGNN